MVKLKFYCVSEDGTNIEVISNSTRNELYISIEHSDEILGNLLLDKQTAIKLSKELRKQIALID